MSFYLTERLEELVKAQDSGLITEEECTLARTRLLEFLAIVTPQTVGVLHVIKVDVDSVFALLVPAQVSTLELLLLIPPPSEYGIERNPSTTTQVSCPKALDAVEQWTSFLENVRSHQFSYDIKTYERPVFVKARITCEADVQSLIYHNILWPLNDILKGCSEEFIRGPGSGSITLGEPDFICKTENEYLLFPVEAKTKWVMSAANPLYQAYPMAVDEMRTRGLRTHPIQDSVVQIFTYMISNGKKYGILSTYDEHWFFYSPNGKILHISDSVPLSSSEPTVLQCYAYMCDISADSDNFSFYLASGQEDTSGIDKDNAADPNYEPKESKGQRKNNLKDRGEAGASRGRPVTRSMTRNVNQYTCNYLSLKDIHIIRALGYGESGSTFLVTYCGELLALKVCDLSKHPQLHYQLEHEVFVYKFLQDLQGKSIPKLACWGRLDGSFIFALGMSMCGRPVEPQKLTNLQKKKALDVLKSVHQYGIIHGDLREDNILVNDNGKVMLIDFGRAVFTRSNEEHNKEITVLKGMLHVSEDMDVIHSNQRTFSSLTPL
ncbi:11440_t:CDS:2 [Paraglomus brasilianum]|uniref:11440_t:CDS:1 n=1 Tax=Paraglomus brasilianum TaxID=144538 RepID=A0A9N9D908_9GLOM|nr:11440_t:CDS:2 [Paraglomus brasilianum]